MRCHKLLLPTGENNTAIINENSTVNIKDVDISVAGDFSKLIYNREGTVNIEDSGLSAVGYRCNAIHNYEGTVNIEGGNISVDGQLSYAIHNYNGTVNIKDNDISAVGFRSNAILNDSGTVNIIGGSKISGEIVSDNCTHEFPSAPTCNEPQKCTVCSEEIGHIWESNNDGTHKCTRPVTRHGCGTIDETCSPNDPGDACESCGYVTPSYGISLDVTGTHTFTEATAGYSSVTAHTVTVNNKGNQATGVLSVALSGTNASSFTLSATSISSIAKGGDSTFTVKPNDGLSVGTYTATVTVSGGANITAQTFDVSFTVSAAPTYGISLDTTGTHIFTETTAGYNPVVAHAVTVKNTGNQATGDLTVELSGTNPTSFTLSTTSISSIAVGGNSSFTVKPNDGLSAGTYTAIMTVNGGNGISESFNVSFTVSAASPEPEPKPEPKPEPNPEPEPNPPQIFYTVTFDGNGGAVSEESKTVSGGDAIGTLPTATRDDYSFKGWFTEADGGEQISESTKINDNVTFFAGWTADTKPEKAPQLTSKANPIYTITELGANGTWTKGSPFGLTIICNGDINKFKELKVGDHAVSTDHYIKEDGSTKITITPEYLETLAIGTHTTTFIYSDGTTSTTFTILAATSPKTGDSNSPSFLLWIILLSATSIVAIISARRRIDQGI